MKTSLKLIGALLCIALFAVLSMVLPPKAEAQLLGNPTTVVASTNLAASSVALTGTVSTASSSTMALQATVGPSNGSLTTAISILWQGSLDGTSFANTQTFTVTPAGATATTTITNLNVNGARVMRFTAIDNSGNSVVASNFVLKASTKPGL